MEASDDSEPEGDSQESEDMCRARLNHKIQSDFPEAGDVGNSLCDEGEDIELPLFVCVTCGCEFEDDGSLETHQYTHQHITTSPAKIEDSKENINPKNNYQCSICEITFATQNAVMIHMQNHSTLSYNPSYLDHNQDKENQNKRSRKQSQPKRVFSSLWANDEVQIQQNGKENENTNRNLQMVEKYMLKLIKQKGYTCNLCKNLRLSQFKTKARLVLHYLWKHNTKRFECEHCNMQFQHRYQVVLHASREHINKLQSVPAKETSLINSNLYDENNHNFVNSSVNAPVPDITNTSVHKLGLSFFDHSFIHNNTGINNHMPLIIPTFPPT